MKKKRIYCLRIRMDDDFPWGETEYYISKRERDRVERLNRIIGGIRTHSWDERKTPEEIATLI